MAQGNQQKGPRWTSTPTPDYAARDREQWRRGRAQAWDRFAAGALGALAATDLEPMLTIIPLAIETADLLMAARDERFGRE